MWPACRNLLFPFLTSVIGNALKIFQKKKDVISHTEGVYYDRQVRLGCPKMVSVLPAHQRSANSFSSPKNGANMWEVILEFRKWAGSIGDPILLGLPTSRIERTTSQCKSFALSLSCRKLASTINLPSSISGVIFAAACIKCNSCNRILLKLSGVTKFIEI